jgi:hypothetical protein
MLYQSKMKNPLIGPACLVMSLSQASQVFLDTAKDIKDLLDELSRGLGEPSNTNEDDSSNDLKQISVDRKEEQSLSEEISKMQLVENSNLNSKQFL